MITIQSLWLAILLSAVLVWIANALVWMLLPYHKTDYKGLPDEEGARNALNTKELAPGQYDIPHIPSRKDLKNPDVIKKFTDGPVGYFTVLKKGVPTMGKNMILSFIYYGIVGFIIAYLASRILDPSVEYLTVFRFTGTIAWLAYGWGVIPDAIWFGKPWSSIIKNLVDSLIYALLTAGVFSWQWISMG
ncbi:hypothetical protein ACFLTE_06810 [Bacteroidota bacterium]